MVDNLSRSLQAKHCDVRRSRLDGAISSPVLTRHRKVPRRLEIGESVSEQSTSTGQDRYRMIYFQVIDTTMRTIKDRFDQRGFLMLQKLETLLISRSAMDRILRSLTRMDLTSRVQTL